MPQWGTSNEYPQHMFLWRNKKYIYLLLSLKQSYDFIFTNIKCTAKFSCCFSILFWFLPSITTCKQGTFLNFLKEYRYTFMGNNSSHGNIWLPFLQGLHLKEKLTDLLSWGLTTCQPLWVTLCCLPEKGRRETEEIVEKMKKRDQGERGKWMKVNKQKK